MFINKIVFVQKEVTSSVLSQGSFLENIDYTEPCDFETAIAATGYGKFHYLLLIIALPGFIACASAMSNMSYVLSSAECDLGMTLMSKGVLNSITFLGCISTAIIWGTLSDTLGRRNLLICGFFALAIIEVIGAMSQSLWMLLATKFISGAIMNGPGAVQMSYISEVQPTKKRAKVLILVGMFYTLADMSIPLFAWAVIPNDWEFSFFNGSFVIHSWNIFLITLSLTAWIAFVAWIAAPESPKFLMSRGRNEEALKVFQYIYSANTGKSPESYPVKILVDEVGKDEIKPQGWAALKDCFKQMKPLLHKQHLKWLLLLCFIDFTSNLGSSAMRLWFPQIATIIEDFSAENTGSTNLCVMLEPHISNSATSSPISIDAEAAGACVKLATGFYTYFNSLIVNASSLLTFVLGAAVIDIIGKKYLAALSFFITAACVIAVPLSSGKVVVVILYSIIVSVSSTGVMSINAVTVDLFPTSLRVMALCIYLMFGRSGTVVGNVVFSALLETGCWPPFIATSALITAATIGCFLLPNTNFKRMV